MATVDDYKKGIDYEIFVQRANRVYDNSKPGMHGSIMQNLIRVENGDTSFVKFHGSYEKQFEKIKTYMNKAMDKYLKMKKIPAENLNRIQVLKTQIDRASSSDSLMNIIHETIELTQCVKDY
jgi:hypothetical protein